jgi:hypothetical protein
VDLNARSAVVQFRVSQAGFCGGFESRTICPRDRRPSENAQTEEVSPWSWWTVA